ncbi:MAG: GDSL-type esterase/lipase family protein [Candidatus Saccharimonadales bacterium]
MSACGLLGSFASPVSAEEFFPRQSTAYVALGDSVSAGFGLDAGTEISHQDQLCSRSSLAYPYLVGQTLNTKVRQLACSGATFDEGLYGRQEIQGIKLPEQIARAFENATPSKMSITVGANDMRWGYFIRKCYVATCGTDVDKALFKLLQFDMRFEQWRMRT